MVQIPPGPKDMYCPLWRKQMCKVCHTCPWWFNLKGKDPNTKQDLDEWRCAIAWAPTLSVEIAQQSRSTTAEVHEMRNENEQTTKTTHELIATAVVQNDRLERALPPVKLKEITNGS